MAFTKISIKKASFTGDTTAGNTTINNVSILNSLTPSLIVGDIVRGNGIPTDTRIVSITGSSITLDKNAIATATGVQLSTFTDDVVSKRSQGFFDAINVNTVSFDGTDDVFVPGSRINIEEPENSVPGELWWDPTDGNLYVYYDDGINAQWVEAVFGSSGGGSSGTPSSAADITYDNTDFGGIQTNVQDSIEQLFFMLNYVDINYDGGFSSSTYNETLDINGGNSTTPLTGIKQINGGES